VFAQQKEDEQMKVRIILTLFAIGMGFTIFPGCATDIGGFSLLDASPTSSTIQKAEQVRQAHLARIIEALNQVPKGSLDDQSKSAAKEVLLKLKDLDSVTEMGVNYRDYPTYVRNARFELNRFSSQYNRHASLITALQLCIDPYVQAQGHFSEYVQMQRGTIGEGRYRFYLHDRWITGHESIKIVESRLQEM
jgi:hypothetical protein